MNLNAKPPAEEQVQPTTTMWRSAKPRSEFLLIINKGPGALAIHRAGDSWDLMEIYFMKRDIESAMTDPNFSSADHLVFETDRNMRKFAIIKRAFELNPHLLEYDYVMMLDDDLIPVNCAILDIFQLFKRSGFRVGQPALTVDSYCTHEILKINNKYTWRKTNFVEVMCPIMTRDAIKDYMPVFDANISGFGLDVMWSYQEWTQRSGVVVLDATPLKHTRPVRGGVAYQGLSQAEERLEFFERHKLKNYLHLTLGGQLRKTGEVIGGSGDLQRSTTI